MWYRYGHGDVASAMPSVTALLIALMHLNRTGEGQFMWSSIFHGSMTYTADSWLDSDGKPCPRPALDPEQLGLDALYRLYETQDGWLQLAALREDHWAALGGALRRPELLADPRFGDPAGRARHRAELTSLLAEVFMTDIATTWRRTLLAAGVPAEVSVDTWDGETILFDDELERLGLVTEYQHPLLGRVRQFGNLITFGATPGRQERATPMVGQHTREILAEMGYGDAAVEDLGAHGVVRWPDGDYPYGV
jgi:crotonobetainyl-CoA:carnitine CoA-transferase CaiB-like acyl-CoA transferase